MPGHRDCVIVEGDPNVKIDGRMVAFHGHKVSCGATLISSAPASGRS
ncbi:PAAR motif family (plasmid) [Ralstonia pseudosolanacearum FQY_4]|nr:PAAR motif family [Ralstonia pseudosolanacearum FQY_4]